MLTKVTIEHKFKILFAVVYRPRTVDPLENFFQSLFDFNKNSLEVIITGDVNANLESTNPKSRLFRTIVKESKLFIVETGDSFYTCKVPSWLDIFVVSKPEKVVGWTKLGAPYIDGHDYLILDYHIIINTQNFNFFYRNINNIIQPNFTKDLISVFSSFALHDNSNIHLEVRNLTNSLLEILEYHAPLKRYNSKRKPNRLINAEIKNLIIDRNFFYKQYKIDKNFSMLQMFRNTRKIIKTKLRNLKNKMIYDSLTGMTDSKTIWKTLNKLGITQQKSKGNALDFLNEDDLAAFFSQTYCQHPQCTLEEVLQLLRDTPVTTNRPIFRFDHIDHDETTKAITQAMPKSQGNSPDTLSLRYFVNNMHLFVNTLTEIFNFCTKHSVYPDIWKTTLTVPICKVPEPKSPKNVRPITNQCHLAKIFDKILCPRIMSFLENQNLLSSRQSGFRKQYSTQTALLDLIDHIKLNIENGKVTVIVMLDFSLAFNSIKHIPILKFLRECNFSDESILFIYHYLFDRNFYIKNKNKLYPQNSGIPQGTGPGPLLFISGTNRVVSLLRYVICKLFVDDMDFYESCTLSELPNLIRNINRDLETVIHWAKEVGISVNPTKTVAMIFGTPKKVEQLKNLDYPSIIVDNIVVPFTSSARNLGIILSSDLTWNDHISKIISQVNGILQGLYRRSSCLPRSIKINLIKSLVFPCLDYACLTYDSLTKYLDSKLLKLQNRCTRFIFNLRKDTRITPFRRRLNWLTPCSRRKYFMGVLTYNIILHKRPLYLYSVFEDFYSIPTRCLRSNSQQIFDIPLILGRAYDSSFQTQAMKFWNQLPIQIRNSESLNIFKTKLFKFLFDRDVDT